MERSALVTYGSETGNACDYAQELGQVVRRLRFITDVVPFDAIREVCLHSPSNHIRR